MVKLLKSIVNSGIIRFKDVVHISGTGMIAMRNVATHLLEVVDPAKVVDESGGVERVEA